MAEFCLNCYKNIDVFEFNKKRLINSVSIYT